MDLLKTRAVLSVSCIVALLGVAAGPASVAASAAPAGPLTRRGTHIESNVRAFAAQRRGRSSVSPATPGPSTASASSASDPGGDNSWGFDPHGDIRTFSVSHNGPTIVASLSTTVFDNPSTSYNWRAWQIGDPAWLGPTGIVFSLDTDNDYVPEYDVYFVWTPSSGVVSDVTPFDQPENILCSATPHWNAGTATYSSDIPASCVGSPTVPRMTAYMRYETRTTISEDVTAFTAPAPSPPTCSTHDGYWLLGRDGGVFSFGPNAQFYGSTGNLHLNQPVLGMTSAPDASGYWFVASDGGVFTYGPGAHFYGSTGAIHLNQPIVGMAATPTGHGYWLVARDGGIFSYGDAKFYGSTGAIHLNQPIVGMAATPTGHGYWMVASDGGLFTFGPSAHFYGSMGGTQLAGPIVGMHVAGLTDGYRMAGSDGSVFSFHAQNCGSLSGQHLAAPIVAIETAGSPL